VFGEDLCNAKCIAGLLIFFIAYTMAKQNIPATGLLKKKQVSVTNSKQKKNDKGDTNIYPVIGGLKISKKASPDIKKKVVLAKLNGRAEKNFTKDIRDMDMSQPGPGDEFNMPTVGDDLGINYGLGEDKNNYAGDDHGE
jgi:hypothetical protein